MKRLPVALQVYSVRDFAEKDFVGTMKQVKKMGYDGVELAGLYDNSAEDIKSILDQVGLQLVSAHLPLNELAKDSVLDLYARIGLKYIAIPWMQIEEASEQWTYTTAMRFRRMGERCRNRGMQLLYHNHDFEFQKVNDKYILDWLFQLTNHTELQTELDTCWIRVGGEDPVKYIHKYSNRAPIVHIKDYVGQKTENMYALIDNIETTEKQSLQFQFRPVGYGRQDVASLVNAAIDAGTEWLVVEQDNPSLHKTSMECAKMSIDYLMQLMD